MRREACTLAFEGAFRDGRGAGLFTFTARPAFAGEMRSLGFSDDLPPWRMFQLAVHDVGPKYIRELKAEGYDKLTLDQIQRAKTHGVTIDYVKGIKGEGFRTVTLETLVRTHDHGVTPEYISDMRSHGMQNLSIDQLVSMRIHGID